MTSRRRMRIAFVKRSLVAAAVAALLTGPIALLLSDPAGPLPESDSRRGGPATAQVQREPDAADTEEGVALLPPGTEVTDRERDAPGKARGDEGSPTPRNPAREEIRRLRKAGRPELLRVAREGDGDLQRLAAVNVLWARGEREVVEELVREAEDDRVLAAKLEALQRSR